MQPFLECCYVALQSLRFGIQPIIHRRNWYSNEPRNVSEKSLPFDWGRISHFPNALIDVGGFGKLADLFRGQFRQAHISLFG